MNFSHTAWSAPSRGLKANRCRATDKRSQFTAREWPQLPSQPIPHTGMGRRGNCHDRAIGAPLVQAQWRGPSRKASSSSSRATATAAVPSRPGKPQGRTSSSILRRSIIRNARTQTTACCRPLTPKQDSRNGTRRTSGKIGARHWMHDVVNRLYTL